MEMQASLITNPAEYAAKGKGDGVELPGGMLYLGGLMNAAALSLGGVNVSVQGGPAMLPVGVVMESTGSIVSEADAFVASPIVTIGSIDGDGNPVFEDAHIRVKLPLYALAMGQNASSSSPTSSCNPLSGDGSLPGLNETCVAGCCIDDKCVCRLGCARFGSSRTTLSVQCARAAPPACRRHRTKSLLI